MLKQRRYCRIVAFMMFLLMSFTSTGFSINLHYCQDELQHIGLFGNKDSCQHEKKKKNCCKKKHIKKCCQKKILPTKRETNKSPIFQKRCCQDYTTFLDIDSDLPNIDDFPLPIFKDAILSSFPSLIYIHYKALNHLITIHTLIPFIHYRPPPRVLYLPILHQSFLC